MTRDQLTPSQRTLLELVLDAHKAGESMIDPKPYLKRANFARLARALATKGRVRISNKGPRTFADGSVLLAGVRERSSVPGTTAMVPLWLRPTLEGRKADVRTWHDRERAS